MERREHSMTWKKKWDYAFYKGTKLQKQIVKDILNHFPELDVSDVVSANIFCMQNRSNAALLGKAFDVGTGNNISINEMKDTVRESLPNLKFDYVADRPGDVRLTKANIQPLLDLGWKPEVDISEGIKRCFQTYCPFCSPV